MTIEKRYEFKKDLMQIHKPDLKDPKKTPNADDFVFTDGTVVLLPPMADPTVTQGALGERRRGYFPAPALPQGKIQRENLTAYQAV